MNSRVHPSFWQAYNDLPLNIQRQAKRAYLIWLSDPSYPALQFKRVSEARPLYSVRIMNTGYRALGILQGDTIIWRWIGSHDAYDRLIG